MTILNNAARNQIEQSLFLLAMNGQRVYYPFLSHGFNRDLEMSTCLIFKIKQRIPFDLLDELVYLEDNQVIEGRHRSDKFPTDFYMTQLCDYIAQHTWENSRQKLSDRLSFRFPTGPFEEWLESTCDRHWMTAEWFRKSDGFMFDDYAILISVFIPLPQDIESFENEYSNFFTLTKMGMH